MKLPERSTATLLLSALFALTLHSAHAQAQEGDDGDGFAPIFDGKSLEGWDFDPKFWRVEDGAITGESTADKKVEYNTFCIWERGEDDDFELKLEFKLTSELGGNSGIQVRSFRLPDEDGTKKWRVGGYQADFESGDTYSGIVYGEAFRGILALRGQKTEVVREEGEVSTRVVGTFGDPAELGKLLKKGEWNTYHIECKGHMMTNRINGQIMAQVTDLDTEARLRKGLLALQMHVGNPMKVQFRHVMLKRLPLGDLKKVAFFAGNPSHGRGAHEHRAGCQLLAKELDANASDQLLTTVYTNGWPADPTALQNADAVVIFCDGGDGHLARPHLRQLDFYMKKGVGLGCIHYAVEITKGEAGDSLKEWTGGYFETHWSVNPHWTAKFDAFPEHPVTRGVKPFEVHDEWYYHMRFKDEMKGVTPILTAVPPKETLNRPDGPHSGNPAVRATEGQPQHVHWVVEREDGGRGFGFTGAHFHKNWGDDSFRKVVLNAITWIAKGEVPEGGVPSATPTQEELDSNLDD